MSLLGAFLLLPVGVGPDLPGLPPLTRHRIALIVAVAVALVLQPHAASRLLRHRGMLILTLVSIVTPVISALTNRDAYAGLHRMTFYDGYMVAVGNALDLALPCLLGVALIRRREDVRILLLLLAGSALLYSFLALFEVRMAPVLHREIYGFLPNNSWGQAKRFGGWRPMVFTPHGLALARYMLMGLLAAAVLHRTGRPVLGVRAYAATLFLAVVLVLGKSLGAITFGAVLLPLVLMLSPRRLATLAIALGVIVISYPMSRALDVFPTETLVNAAQSIEAERAESLAYRFFNEDMLLDHAFEKPFFGWGGWGRNRVYDPQTKEILSTAVDGYWIVTLGYHGLVGFVTTFGILLVGPMLAALRVRRIRPPRAQIEIVGLALITVVYAADLLPNGFPMSFMAFTAGGVAGALPAFERPLQRRRRVPGKGVREAPPKKRPTTSLSEGLLGPRSAD